MTQARLFSSLGCLAFLALLSCAGVRGRGEAAPAGGPAPAGAAPGLRPLADARGLLLGAAVMPGQLEDRAFAETLVRNFSSLTPENSMKWDTIHPAPDRYSFDDADRIVAFARAHGMAVRGHTLAWHSQNPGWLQGSDALASDPAGVLRDHITTVVGHFRGQIRDWDVVNEPLDENGALRKNVWLLALGPGYIEQAFRWAHAADPQAKLFLNEYGNEALGPKSDAFHALVKDLLAKGVPLHGVGLQFHLDGKYNPDFGAVAQNLARLRALGVEVQITELDVRLKGEPTHDALAQQAQIYAELVRAALAYRLSAVVTWGLTDRYSWVPSFFRGHGSALLFDDDYRPKPAALAVREVLAGPPPGPAHFAKYATGPARTAPPFRATRAEAAPVLDGDPGDAAWKEAYAYELAFNQIASGDMAPPASRADVSGTLRVVFRGSRLYGLLRRADDRTVTMHKDPWENDNFELFYRLDGAWKQIRTLAGQDWQPDQRPADGKAVWSADGSVLEFEVELGSPLGGRTIGFSAALSDNDTPERAARECQLYPVPGNNTGWQGKGFGELTFEDDAGAFPHSDVIGDAMPFAAGAAAAPPALDGDPADPQWAQATRYPLAFDQLSRAQTVPATAALPGTFRLLAAGGSVYGLVQLAAGAAQARWDAVEVALLLEGTSVVRVAPAGKDFAAAPGARTARAVWSADRRTLEFEVRLSDASLAGKRARFALGLAGALPGGARVLLAPFPGYARLQDTTGADLGALMSRQAADTAELVLP
ncbi:MAG TPA: endo-1,4-beta-xylanase [Anaeromyxobacter sp.]|nr:endo-1,4-beta-xylanase [Anaeromyxobacter sp.]